MKEVNIMNSVKNELREKLADLSHKIWSRWMKYLFSKCIDEIEEKGDGYECHEFKNTGCMIIPKWAVDRWKKQINTFYNELTEKEKDSNREQADKIIKLLEDFYIENNIEIKGVMNEEIRTD